MAVHIGAGGEHAEGEHVDGVRVPRLHQRRTEQTAPSDEARMIQ